MKTTHALNPVESLTAAVLHKPILDLAIAPYVPARDLAIAGANSLEIGFPDAAQLDKINSLLPYGASPYEADSVVSVPFLASHNLMSFSRAVWDIETGLAPMAAQYPGRPLQVDHDWYSVDSNQGFIYDSMIVRSPVAPSAIANAGEWAEVNRRIMSRDGFAGLVLWAAVPLDRPILGKILDGSIDSVSTGSMVGDLWCPDCNKSSWVCPCVIPWGFSAATIRRLRERDYSVPDYYVRRDTFGVIELSLVVSGNLPGAGVLRRGS